MQAQTLCTAFKANTPVPHGQTAPSDQQYVQQVIRGDIANGSYTQEQLNDCVFNMFDLENSILLGTNTQVATELTELQYHLQTIFSHVEMGNGFDSVETPISNSVRQMNDANIPYITDDTRMALHMSTPPPNGVLERRGLAEWAARLSTETVLGAQLKELATQLETYRVPEQAYGNLEVYAPSGEDYFTGDRYGTQFTGVDMYGGNGTSYLTHLLNEKQERISEEDMEECIMETFCLTQNNYSCMSWLHKTLFHIRGESRFRESQLFIIVETIRHIFLSLIFSTIQRPVNHSVYPLPMWRLKQD